MTGGNERDNFIANGAVKEERTKRNFGGGPGRKEISLMEPV